MSNFTSGWQPSPNKATSNNSAPTTATSKPEGINLNVELYWAQLDQVNAMSGKFQVDLCGLSDAAVSKLAELGIEARAKADSPEKGYFITTKSTRPITAYLDGAAFTGKVGNGTKARATVGAYEWNYQGKKGVSPSLQRLNITELVRYEADGVAEGELEEAF